MNTIRGTWLLTGAVIAATVLAATAQREQQGPGTVVVGSTGRGLSDVTVKYDRAGHAVRETSTDASGRFEFNASEVGVVSVSHPGYATAHRRWPPASDKDARIELEPAAAISGSLTDSVTLEPLAGSVTVVVRQIPHQSVSTTVDVDADGNFLIDDLPSGAASLVGTADGYAPATSEFRVNAGLLRSEHMRLASAVMLRGHVLGAGGTPVSGAEVMAEYIAAGVEAMLTGFIGGVLTTSSEGLFVLANLRSGETLRVWAEHDGGTTNIETVAVRALDDPEQIILRFAN